MANSPINNLYQITQLWFKYITFYFSQQYHQVADKKFLMSFQKQIYNHNVIIMFNFQNNPPSLILYFY